MDYRDAVLDEDHLRDFWHGIDMAGIEEADDGAEAGGAEIAPESPIRSIDGDNNEYDDPEDSEAIELIGDDPDRDWDADSADDNSFVGKDSVDYMDGRGRAPRAF